jgi:hypothetical protein
MWIRLYAEGAPLRIEEKGATKFEDQGLAAYGRLCPTALGSVPPRVRPPNNSRTPSRALRHTLTPLQECGSVQTWLYLVT